MGRIDLPIGDASTTTPGCRPPRQRRRCARAGPYACEAASLAPGERGSVGTGIAIELDRSDHAGLVLPRSGLAARHGISLVNAPGRIDSGYRGEVRVLLLNTDRTETFEIAPGDRIAQLLVTPLSSAEPVEAAELAISARGDGGFGSSGR